MSKDDFLAIRRAPTGRAGVFDVEALLMRDLKPPPTEKKAAVRSTRDNFAAAVQVLFDGRINANDLFGLTITLRHAEDLDPFVLAVAAWLRSAFPNGASLTREEGSGKLSPFEFTQQWMDDLASKILTSQKSGDGRNLAAAKVDIFAYYQMFFI